MKRKTIRLPGLIASILLAEGVGALAALLSGGFGSTYNSLRQPPFAPPSWLFPVAWVILYALMGIAAYLVWSTLWSRPDERSRALFLYALQLAVNFFWPIVFFRWRMLFAALLVLLALDALVVLTAAAFRQVSPKAALLLVPYLVWIFYATYLNLGIALLN